MIIFSKDHKFLFSSGIMLNSLGYNNCGELLYLFHFYLYGLIKRFKLKFKPGTVEKNESTLGPPAGT